MVIWINYAKLLQTFIIYKVDSFYLFDLNFIVILTSYGRPKSLSVT